MRKLREPESAEVRRSLRTLRRAVFCAVGGAEARLEGFEKVIGVEMGLELCGDDAFKGFGEEGEVGDWAVVTEGGGVETRFLEGGGDSSRFEGRGDRSMGQ